MRNKQIIVVIHQKIKGIKEMKKDILLEKFYT